MSDAATGPLVAALGLVASTLVACGGTERPTRPPNIVLVVVDTLRADRLGCYGNRRGLTPTMDRLASEGTLFRHAYAPSSWTNPSIASLLTSRYPSDHGVRQGTSMLPASERTLPELLRDQGYATGGFVANPFLDLEHGFGQGFDVYEVATIGRVRFPVNTRAAKWVGQLVARRYSRPPIFLYVHYMETHLPYGRTTRLYRFLDGRPPPDLDEVNQRLLVSRVFGLPRDLLPAVEDAYNAEVAEVDGQLWQLLAILRGQEVLDDAIVVMTADHGEEFLDHGGTLHGTTLYNELIHVPLVIVAPGRARRARIDDTVGLIDVAPSILELAGLPIPPSFLGRSLKSMLSRGRLDMLRYTLVRPFMEPGLAFSELAKDRWLTEADATAMLRAVIRGSEKVITAGDEAREFYDLGADPREREPGALTDAARARLEPFLTEFTRREPAHAESRPLEESDHERLRALGYAQ